MIRYDETEKNNYQYVVVEVECGTGGHQPRPARGNPAGRRTCSRAVTSIPAATGWSRIALTSPMPGLLLPHTEKLSLECMILPTGTAVEAEDAVTISRLIRVMVENAPKVRRQLDARAA